MRIKSLALATTLSLLSTSALVGVVHAQKGVTLQPQSSWAVKRVNADSPNAYCALARRFEQDLILTLAKNDKHEISFAIDFPQGNFSAHERYEVSLDPGAGEQRKFKVKPASSGKAFVVRVGSDQKFMSALLRTGYLRIVLNNESYNFNLADIDQGQEQLEACLYAGMTPAAGGDGGVSVPSYTQVSDLRAEKKKLEERLQKLEQENENLRLRSTSTAAQPSANVEPNTQSALQVTSSPAVDGLLTQIKSLKAENAELQKLADASRNNAPVSTDVSVVELARENQRLQTLLQEQKGADSYKQEVEQLTQRITSLENENLSLVQQKSSGFSGEEKQGLERQILALKSENGALRESIARQTGSNNGDFADIKEELSGLEQENARLNLRVSSLMSEKTSVMEQLGYYEDENEKLRNANNSSDTALLAQLREEIRKIEGDNARLLAQKEGEIATLQSDLHALKTEQSRAQASSEDIKRQVEQVFKTQIEALGIKNEALKEELLNLSRDQSLLDDFKNKVDAVTQEKLALQDNLDNAQAKIADLQAQIDTQQANKKKNEEGKVALGLQLDGLNAEIASLQASVSELTSQNETLQADLLARSSGDQELKVQIEGYQEELASLESQNKALKGELEGITGQNNAQAAKMAGLLEQNEALRAQLKAYQNEHQGKVASLEESLRQLNAANARLSEQANADVAALEESLKQASATNAQLREEAANKVAMLSGKLEESDAASLILRQETAAKISSLEEKLEQAYAANTQSSEQKDATVAALEQELMGLRRELENMQSEKLATAQSNEQKEAAIAALEQELLGLRNELESAQSEKLAAVSMTEELKPLSEEIALKDAQLEQMRAAVERQTAALEEQGMKIDEQNLSISSLQENLSALENENKDLVLALNNASTFNEELQKDWSETLASYQALQEENAAVVLAVNEVESEIGAARTEQSEKLEALQRKNKDLSAQLEAQAREYLVLVRDMETLKQQKTSTEPQSVSVDTDEVDALRTNNKILKGEVDILRQQLARKELPQAREASLRQDEQAFEMGSHARGTREESLEQRRRQSEREEITRLAAMEPAAGDNAPRVESENVSSVSNNAELEDTMQTGAVQQSMAVREVIDELQMNDANLSEAQKLERSLKSQIERSARSSASQEASYTGPSTVINEISEPTSRGIKPIESVMQESIEDERSTLSSAAVPISQNGSVGMFSPNVNVANLLAAANIDLAVPVSLVSNSSGTDRVAYQWRSKNDLYGSAHQKKIANINEFDNYVRDYLTMTEERCTGDFAIIPSSTEQVGQTRIDSYEIACVGAGVNSSASVVFFNSDETFTVLAHEGPTEGMETAMDARDKIVSMVERS